MLFRSGATVTSVTIGDDEIINDLDVSGFATNKNFFIPWADGNHDDGYTSKYANGVNIVITYSATLTDIVKVDGTDGNKNVVEIKPYVDTPDDEEPQPREENWKDDHEIFTHAAALKKTDGTKALAGATFQIYGLTAVLEDANVPGIYRVTKYNPTAADSKTKGSNLVVNNDGMIYILGISNEVTLTGTEEEAPAGYNKLTSEFDVTVQTLGHEVWSTAGTRKFDADGNVIAETSTAHHTNTVTKTIDDLSADAVEIVNNAGTELPATGGIGTTIFYVDGSILVLAAAILLITKRRMGAND